MWRKPPTGNLFSLTIVIHLVLDYRDMVIGRWGFENNGARNVIELLMNYILNRDIIQFCLDSESYYTTQLLSREIILRDMDSHRLSSIILSLAIWVRTSKPPQLCLMKSFGFVTAAARIASRNLTPALISITPTPNIETTTPFVQLFCLLRLQFSSQRSSDDPPQPGHPTRQLSKEQI